MCFKIVGLPLTPVQEGRHLTIPAGACKKPGKVTFLDTECDAVL